MNSLLELEVVLHRGYGAFHIDDEMALWLMEHRGWTMVKGMNAYPKGKWPMTCLDDECHDFVYSPHGDTIEFRSHPDLIACVKALKELHKNDSHSDKMYGHIHKLKIAKMEISAGIEDYNDGYERLNCSFTEI